MEGKTIERYILEAVLQLVPEVRIFEINGTQVSPIILEHWKSTAIPRCGEYISIQGQRREVISVEWTFLDDGPHVDIHIEGDKHAK